MTYKITAAQRDALISALEDAQDVFNELDGMTWHEQSDFTGGNYSQAQNGGADAISILQSLHGCAQPTAGVYAAQAWVESQLQKQIETYGEDWLMSEIGKCHCTGKYYEILNTIKFSLQSPSCTGEEKK